MADDGSKPPVIFSGRYGPTPTIIDEKRGEKRKVGGGLGSLLRATFTRSPSAKVYEKEFLPVMY